MAKKSKYADNTAELKKRISSDNLNGIFVFFGEEKYSRDSAIEMIKQKFTAAGFEEFNVLQLEDKSPSLDDLASFINSYPMMSESKLLILRASEIMKKASEQAANFWAAAVKDFPSYLTVIIDQDAVDSRLSVSKKIMSAALCVEFVYKTPAEAAKWCVSMFKKQDITVSQDTAFYLTAACDPGLYSLKSEIDKLCAACSEQKTVTTADIDLIVQKSAQNRIFEMLDAIIQGRGKAAFEMLADMKILNEAPVKIIALLGSTVIKLYKTSVLLDSGCSRYEVASKIGVAPFIAEKYTQMAHSRKTEIIGKMLSLCAEYDYKIKSGQLGDWSAAELLISEILSM